MTTLKNRKLKVAIIGAGPAGLGLAIEFQKIPFVSWRLYEKGPEISEIGAGIQIPQSTWRMLDVMGASKNFDPKDYFRPHDGHYVQHRNGRTEELLVINKCSSDIPEYHRHARTHRAVLQNALLKEVNMEYIRLSKKLVEIIQLPSGRIVIEFEDGFRDEVDLIIGADGVRSIVRTFMSPKHKISYTGKTSYRTVVSCAEMNTIPNVPYAITFWQGPRSWLCTCPLGNNLFSITSFVREPDQEGKKGKVSWGQEARLEQMTRHFEDFGPTVKAMAALPKKINEYALFAGPRLGSIVGCGAVALVGDASHPLSGAFGAGAGFALEDAFTLTQSISWAYKQNLTLNDALTLYDKVRSPHYAKMYEILDGTGAIMASLEKENLGFDETMLVLKEKVWGKKQLWIHEYDVQSVFKEMAESMVPASYAENGVNEGDRGVS